MDLETVFLSAANVFHIKRSFLISDRMLFELINIVDINMWQEATEKTIHK